MRNVYVFPIVNSIALLFILACFLEAWPAFIWAFALSTFILKVKGGEGGRYGHKGVSVKKNLRFLYIFIS